MYFDAKGDLHVKRDIVAVSTIPPLPPTQKVAHDEEEPDMCWGCGEEIPNGSKHKCYGR
jgi:hypothetical protein